MISVCMATYNGEKFIRSQIESILTQLGPADELIISDDGSADNTLEIIKEFRDNRIKIYKGNFKNFIRNFENALTKAKGEFIFLSDQDDVWESTKVQRILPLLQQFDLVISDSSVVDEELNPLNPSFFKLLRSGKGIVKNVLKSTYYGSCMAFRKNVLTTALPFPDTTEIGHDLWLGLVAEMTGSVLFLEEPLIKYRRHNATFTVTGVGKSKRSLLLKLKGRVIITKEIFKFYLKYRLCKKA